MGPRLALAVSNADDQTVRLLWTAPNIKVYNRAAESGEQASTFYGGRALRLWSAVLCSMAPCVGVSWLHSGVRLPACGLRLWSAVHWRLVSILVDGTAEVLRQLVKT